MMMYALAGLCFAMGIYNALAHVLARRFRAGAANVNTLEGLATLWLIAGLLAWGQA